MQNCAAEQSEEHQRALRSAVTDIRTMTALRPFPLSLAAQHRAESPSQQGSAFPARFTATLHGPERRYFRVFMRMRCTAGKAFYHRVAVQSGNRKETPFPRFCHGRCCLADGWP